MHELVLIVLRRPSWRLPALMLTAALLLAAHGKALRADACSDCSAPTLEDLAATPGFTLRSLPPDLFGFQPTDYVEIDAGECTYKPKTDPTVNIVSTRLVLRGFGEVWHCPESSSDDEISFSIAEGDSTEWHVEGEVGATLKAVALELAAKLKGGVTTGRTVTEVRTIKKTLRAAMGHRIPWEGYFEIASLSVTAEFNVTRRWSWWTKSLHTGHTVLRSGSIWMSCGSETVVLARDASIGYRMQLGDRACALMDPAPHRDLGFFPPTPPPTTPGAGTGAKAAPAAGPVHTTVTTPPTPATDDDEPFQPFPPPSPTNPHPRDSSEMGTAPTGPLPDPHATYTLSDGTVAAVVSGAAGSDA